MGLALLDTSIVIAVLNHRDALHPAARRSLLAARDRHALAMSSLPYAEILVGPLRAGEDAVEIVERGERFAPAQLRMHRLTAAAPIAGRPMTTLRFVDASTRPRCWPMPASGSRRSSATGTGGP